jgi:hypothetical protein
MRRTVLGQLSRTARIVCPTSFASLSRVFTSSCHMGARTLQLQASRTSSWAKPAPRRKMPQQQGLMSLRQWYLIMCDHTALEVVRRQAEAQVAVAREERQQRRLEEAYLEMLAAITSIHYWVYTVYPVLTKTPEQFTMPPLPEFPDSASKEALWTAYWSPRVEQLMKDWEAAVRKLQSTGIHIGIGRSTEQSGQVTGIDVPALLLGLQEQKREVIDADKRVREQVRLELLGQHDGHAEEVAVKPSPSS